MGFFGFGSRGEAAPQKREYKIDLLSNNEAHFENESINIRATTAHDDEVTEIKVDNLGSGIRLQHRFNKLFTGEDLRDLMDKVRHEASIGGRSVQEVGAALNKLFQELDVPEKE